MNLWLTYDLVGPPKQRWDVPKSTPAALHPSSSFPSSFCVRDNCSPNLLGHSVRGHMYAATAGKQRKERQKERKTIRDRRVEATKLQNTVLIVTEAGAIDQCQLPCTAFCWKQSFWSSALQPGSTWAHTGSFCSTHHMTPLGFMPSCQFLPAADDISRFNTRGTVYIPLQFLCSVLSIRISARLSQRQIHLHWG